MSQLKATVDKLLSRASNALIPEGYISEALLPSVGVKQYTGKLAQYSKQHLRIEMSIKGGRGKYPQVESHTISDTSYSVEGKGLTDIVTKEDYANKDKPYNAENDVQMGLTTKLWLGKEKSLADSLTDTAVITQNTTLAGTNQFSDYLNSDPIAQFSTARKTVRDGIGKPANTVVLDWAVWDKLRYHPQILDALGFKENRPGGLQVSELASAMGVKKVLIAEAVYNNSKQGQSDSIEAVWGKHIVFCYVPDRAMPYQVSLGYMVTIDGDSPRKVYKQNLFNPPGSKEILVEDQYDFLLSDVNGAYLIKNAIA